MLQIARSGKKRIRQDNIGYLFIAPNLFIYFVFILVPSLFTVFYSFTNFNLFEWRFIGILNYQRIFADPFFIKSFWNTMTYAVGTIFISMVAGLALAMTLNSAIPGRKFFRSIFYLPNTISVIAASMAWLYIYNPQTGLLNYLLRQLGLTPRNWLLDVNLALLSIIVMGIWMSVGYNMIVFTSGLQGIPEYLYEAAKIDGAGFWIQFFKITLPMLAPTTFFLFVMSVISSFQVFGQVYTMTNGGPMNATTTIVHQIYNNGFEGYKMGYASAQAMFLLVVTTIITLLTFRYGNKSGDREVA